MSGPHARPSVRRCRPVRAVLLSVGLLLPLLAPAATSAAVRADAAGDQSYRLSSAMLGYDRSVARAMRTADRLTRARLARNPNAAPIPPVLPKVAAQPPVAAAQRSAATTVPLLPTGTRATGPAAALAGCAGNCYQTDLARGDAVPAGTYAFDYMIWIGLPQANETNRCDGPTGAGCFWFISSSFDTDVPGGYLHIGVQRGASAAGDARGSWRISHSGYNDGVLTGAVCTQVANGFCVRGDAIPSATWVRIRIWRLATSYDPTLGVVSMWGSWAMWDGVDRQFGTNLWTKGVSLTHPALFTELNEQENQCSTDFERTYFNAPRALAPSAGGSSWFEPSPAVATASYEANCRNTTFRKLGGTFIVDEREVASPRTLPPGLGVAQGARLWP